MYLDYTKVGLFNEQRTSAKRKRIGYIISVNEKLPVSKFQYFGKYIIQLFGNCNVNVSGLRQTG